ncbi:hypothetical protein CEQ90_07400 [Lewinellaceae bacterium SD302]|nr:hypothetical protein CEQ90_07400 [Lewinellaceae bacterium SD302]
MRFFYSRLFLLIGLVSLSGFSAVQACTCSSFSNTFCGMYGPDTRVYRASIIEYVDIPISGNWSTPTLQVEIIDILNGPDDLGTDTLTLVGQDGLNCATNLPLEYEGEIIFLANYVFFDGYWNNDAIELCVELSGCGPSYLNVIDEEIHGPIGGNMNSGISLIDFINNLGELGDCALSVDVADPQLTAEDFEAYPNPANSRVYIDMINNTSFTELNVSLINTTGKTVRRQSFAGSERLVDIDVANLPSGIYFLRLTTDQGEITKRIVVN